MAAQEWGGVLAGLEGSDIARGISRLPHDWPPGPGAFRLLCKNHTHPSHQEMVSLPRPEVEPEYVESQLAEMRRMLNMEVDHG